MYSKSGERIGFYQDGVMSRISKVNNNVPNNYIEVETITLDEIIFNLNVQPKILKMDIEGAEKFALLGSQTTFKTIDYFEGEIHSLEDYNVLLRYSDQFLFKEEPVESMRNVLLFSLRHPLKILNVEFNNKFLTTRRILATLIRSKQPEKFPMIIYGEKSVG